MTERELIEYIRQDLGITNQVKFSNNPLTAVVDIINSDSFGVIYSKLDKNKQLIELEDSTMVTETNSSIVYTDEQNKDLLITLKADYDGNVYQLVVTDKE